MVRRIMSEKVIKTLQKGIELLIEPDSKNFFNFKNDKESYVERDREEAFDEEKLKKDIWIELNNSLRKIISVRDKQKNLVLIGNVKSLKGPFKVKNSNKLIKVLLFDETSSIWLNLWNDQALNFISFYNSNSTRRIKFTGIYITDYRGQLQGNLAKKGTFEVTTDAKFDIKFPPVPIKHLIEGSFVYKMEIIVLSVDKGDKALIVHGADSSDTITCYLARSKFEHLHLNVGDYLELENFNFKSDNRFKWVYSTESSTVSKKNMIRHPYTNVLIGQSSFILHITKVTPSYVLGREVYDLNQINPKQAFVIYNSDLMKNDLFPGDTIEISGMFIKKGKTIRLFKIRQIEKHVPLKIRKTISFSAREWTYSDEGIRLIDLYHDIFIQTQYLPFFVDSTFENFKEELNINFKIELEFEIEARETETEPLQKLRYNSKKQAFGCVNVLNLDEIAPQMLERYNNFILANNFSRNLGSFQKYLINDYLQKSTHFADDSTIRELAKKYNIKLDSLQIKNLFYNDEQYKNSYFSYLQTAAQSEIQEGQIYYSKKFLIFTFPKIKALVLESPEYGTATYIFDLPKNISRFLKQLKSIKRTEILNSQFMQEKFKFRTRIIHNKGWFRRMRGALFVNLEEKK